MGSSKYLYALLLDMEGPAGLPSGLRPGRPARGPGFDPRFGLLFVSSLARRAQRARAHRARQCHGSATAVPRQCHGSDSGGIWEGVRRRVGAALLGAVFLVHIFFLTIVRLALVFPGETLSFVCILVHGLHVQGL